MLRFSHISRMGERMVDYVENLDGRLWWCNSHERRATVIQIRDDGHRSPHCALDKGGILLPCNCVDITDDAEILTVG